MSHFTVIKTRLVDRKATIQAFKDLGYDVDDTPGVVRGYLKDTTQAALRVRTGTAYDIGLMEEDGGFAMVADWSMLRKPDLHNQVQQRYAYHVTRSKLEAQGFTLVEDRQENDGAIHLTLRRMQ